MSGKKILMLTGEFTEEYEIYVFQKGMEAVGHTGARRLPRQKGGRTYQDLVARLRGDQTYTEKLGHYADIQQDLFPRCGLRSMMPSMRRATRPEYIRTDQAGSGHVRHFHDTGKPIFTICMACRSSWLCLAC